MGKEILFDRKLLWFGAVVWAAFFAISVWSFVTSEDKSGGVVSVILFGGIAGAAVGLIAQVLFTLLLYPVAWYQVYRLQHGATRAQAAFALAVALAIVAAVVLVFKFMLGIELFKTVFGIFSAITLPLVIVVAVIEYRARKKIPILDISTSKELAIK